MIINNAIKTELNKRMLTKTFNLNRRAIFFNVSLKIIKDHSLYMFCIKILNKLLYFPKTIIKPNDKFWHVSKKCPNVQKKIGTDITKLYHHLGSKQQPHRKTLWQLTGRKLVLCELTFISKTFKIKPKRKKQSQLLFCLLGIAYYLLTF